MLTLRDIGNFTEIVQSTLVFGGSEGMKNCDSDSKIMSTCDTNIAMSEESGVLLEGRRRWQERAK